jgi:hypothetical protein
MRINELEHILKQRVTRFAQKYGIEVPETGDEQ